MCVCACMRACIHAHCACVCCASGVSALAACPSSELRLGRSHRRPSRRPPRQHAGASAPSPAPAPLPMGATASQRGVCAGCGFVSLPQPHARGRATAGLRQAGLLLLLLATRGALPPSWRARAPRYAVPPAEQRRISNKSFAGNQQGAVVRVMLLLWASRVRGAVGGASRARGSWRACRRPTAPAAAQKPINETSKTRPRCTRGFLSRDQGVGVPERLPRLHRTFCTP